MAFIKHGDGKIVTVISEDNLTEKQKKEISELTEEAIKKAAEKTK